MLIRPCMILENNLAVQMCNYRLHRTSYQLINVRANLGRPHVVRIQVCNLDVSLTVIEHVDTRLVADGFSRVHSRNDAHSVMGSEALHYRVVDLHRMHH